MSEWWSESEAWAFQLIGDKGQGGLREGGSSRSAAQERHQHQPRACHISQTPQLTTTCANHGRITVDPVPGDAGYGLGTSFITPRLRALLTWLGLEHRRLLLWRRDMQRCYGLLRRKVWKQVGHI
jgi:hypothetical protein